MDTLIKFINVILLTFANNTYINNDTTSKSIKLGRSIWFGFKVNYKNVSKH